MVFDGDDSAPQPLWERLSIELQGASEEPPEPGEAGAKVELETTRGPVHCLLHRAESEGETAVLWCPGARGGFAGPADNLYEDVAVRLAQQGITSLRLDYRHAADLDESVLDALCAVWYLADAGFPRVALVGHSFGGGVVISTSRYTTHVRAVAALASQTLGAEDVVLLSPRPLVLVHGESDNVLPVTNAHLIHGWAFEPKRLVTYPGAAHGLRECAEELRGLLLEWLPGVLPGVLHE